MLSKHEMPRGVLLNKKCTAAVYQALFLLLLLWVGISVALSGGTSGAAHRREVGDETRRDSVKRERRERENGRTAERKEERRKNERKSGKPKTGLHPCRK